MFAKLEARLARVAGTHSGAERTLHDDQGIDAATYNERIDPRPNLRRDGGTSASPSPVRAVEGSNIFVDATGAQ